MEHISVKEVLSESLLLFRQSIPALLEVVIPLLAVVELVVAAAEFFPREIAVVLAICSIVGALYANALSVKTVYSISYGGSIGEMLPIAFIWYIIANGYIVVSFSLTLLLVVFAIPGLLIFVVTSLSPIFILERGEGPIQAVASSCEHIRGNVFRISVSMLVYCAVIFAVSEALSHLASLTGLMSRPLGYCVSLFSSVLWLFHSAAIVVLYRKLHPGKLPDAQPPAAGEDAAGFTS